MRNTSQQGLFQLLDGQEPGSGRDAGVQPGSASQTSHFPRAASPSACSAQHSPAVACSSTTSLWVPGCLSSHFSELPSADTSVGAHVPDSGIWGNQAAWEAWQKEPSFPRQALLPSCLSLGSLYKCTASLSKLREAEQ